MPESPKTLLVIMPAFNEEVSVADVIRRVPREIEGVDSVEVLVIDDGSVDETAKKALSAGATVISHRRNRGVGRAIQTGIEEAIQRAADFAVNIDSDGQFDPTDITKILSPLLKDEADCVTASRFKDPALVPKMPLVKRLGNWGMAKIISSITGQKFADVSCGFRAYSRETMLRLTLTGAFTYTQEMFLDVFQKELRIVEVPMAVRGEREHGSSRVASSLVRYAINTSSIIFSSVRDYSPGIFFNGSALVLVFLSAGFGAFFIWHRIVAGQFTPHIWAGFSAAFLFGLSFLTFVLGQVAIMLARTRRMQDKQMYLLRKYLPRNNGSTTYPPRTTT